MTEQNPPTPPTDDPVDKKPAAKKTAAPKVGDVVQTSPGKYALVVGTEQARHVHQGRDGEQTEVVNRDHPLVIDLTGVARRHEIETLPL